MQAFDFYMYLHLGTKLAYKSKQPRIQRGRAMKWVEIISLRCPGNIETRFIDELLKGVSECDSAPDTSKHLVEIKVFHLNRVSQ
jgi:hypothetical protein